MQLFSMISINRLAMHSINVPKVSKRRRSGRLAVLEEEVLLAQDPVSVARVLRNQGLETVPRLLSTAVEGGSRRLVRYSGLLRNLSGSLLPRRVEAFTKTWRST